MTALTADRQTPSKVMDLKGYPVAASAVIHKGSIVALDSDGFAIPAADTANTIVVGVAEEAVNNGGGADGDKMVRVRSGRAFRFAASSITQAMLGSVMYVVDDQTFDDATGTTNDIPVGYLVEYDSTTAGWIFIPLGGMHNNIPHTHT